MRHKVVIETRKYPDPNRPGKVEMREGGHCLTCGCGMTKEEIKEHSRNAG